MILSDDEDEPAPVAPASAAQQVSRSSREAEYKEPTAPITNESTPAAAPAAADASAAAAGPSSCSPCAESDCQKCKPGGDYPSAGVAVSLCSIHLGIHHDKLKLAAREAGAEAAIKQRKEQAEQAARAKQRADEEAARAKKRAEEEEAARAKKKADEDAAQAQLIQSTLLASRAHAVALTKLREMEADRVSLSCKLEALAEAPAESNREETQRLIQAINQLNSDISDAINAAGSASRAVADPELRSMLDRLRDEAPIDQLAALSIRHKPMFPLTPDAGRALHRLRNLDVVSVTRMALVCTRSCCASNL